MRKEPESSLIFFQDSSAELVDEMFAGNEHRMNVSTKEWPAALHEEGTA